MKISPKNQHGMCGEVICEIFGMEEKGALFNIEIAIRFDHCQVPTDYGISVPQAKAFKTFCLHTVE